MKTDSNGKQIQQIWVYVSDAARIKARAALNRSTVLNTVTDMVDTFEHVQEVQVFFESKGKGDEVTE